MSAASPGDWEGLARSAALPARDEQPVILRELLCFELAGSAYAIPVERVREIVRMRRITRIPRVPSEVLGVIALRGEVVEVVDLRRRLSLECSEPGRRSRLIVLHGDDARVTGVLVDAVREVLRVPENEIEPAGADSDNVSELCVREREFVSIIDIDRVLEFDADHD